jgi:Flp pilus assembly pilin Flp
MRFNQFLKADEGLTTVEWVVLAAVCLLAALGISNMVLGGANELGGAVADQMSDAADDVSPPPAP